MMNVSFGLLFQLVSLISIASADPVVLPVVKTDAGEIGMVFPSDKVLLGIVIGQGLQLIFWMGKSLWGAFIKKSDKTEEKVDQLAIAVQEIKAELKLISKLPNEAEIIERLEDRVEFLAFKAVRDLGIKIKPDS